MLTDFEVLPERPALQRCSLGVLWPLLTQPNGSEGLHVGAGKESAGYSCSWGCCHASGGRTYVVDFWVCRVEGGGEGEVLLAVGLSILRKAALQPE